MRNAGTLVINSHLQQRIPEAVSQEVSYQEKSQGFFLPGGILLFSCLRMISYTFIIPTALPTESFELTLCKPSPKGQLLCVSEQSFAADTSPCFEAKWLRVSSLADGICLPLPFLPFNRVTTSLCAAPMQQ